MSIFNAKYKAHRFVNVIFYAIVFVAGFLIGIGAIYLKFENIFSNFLMIDNVNAANYNYGYPSDLTIPNRNNYYDEEIIHNIFTEMVAYNNLNFDFADYPYVVVNVSNSSGYGFFYFWFSNEPIYISGNQIKPTANSNYINIQVYSNGSQISSSTSLTYIDYDVASSSYFFQQWSSGGSDISHQYYSTNEFVSNSYYKFAGLLDFAGINLSFNENLFANNPDFKEVCVPNNKKFAISSNLVGNVVDDENSSFYGNKSYFSYEFIWFPYKIDGLTTFIYDNSKEDNVWVIDEDETYFEMNPGYWYYLNSKSEIDLYFSRNDPGNYLNSLGYTNKYNYYGWYFHPFIVRYSASGLRQFSIFWFRNNSKAIYLDGSISNELENYCFYIKNDFDVTILNSDEFGDLYGNVEILDGENLNINTTKNVSDLDSKGLFEKIKIFLSKMTNPINFIKDSIYNLYDSMPMLLKLFIFSIFGLCVIKILIGMVVR